MTKNSRKRGGSREMSPYKSLPSKMWIELNRPSCQDEEKGGTLVFNSRGPNDPPQLIVEFEFMRPLKDIFNVEVKVDFKLKDKSKPLSWTGIWDNVKYDIIDSEKVLDAYSKLRLKFTEYPWGEREKQQFARFSFRFNDDDSEVYLSPETIIQSLKTFDRKKQKSRKDLRESIITDRDAILEIPIDLKGKKLFERLSDKDWKGNIVAHAIHRNKEENTERAIQLLSSKSLKVDQRKEILMNFNKFDANILHAAASKGNLKFLKQFRQLYKEWGLEDAAIKYLLSSQEEHHAIPYEMAWFQKTKRGKDMEEVLTFIREWMLELQLYHVVEVMDSLLTE